MFSNGDALYDYVSMRHQDDLAHAARQRLAATAEAANGTRSLPLVISEDLVKGCARVGAFVRNVVAAQPAARPTGVIGRTKADAGMA